jgi:hypothetical protein
MILNINYVLIYYKLAVKFTFKNYEHLLCVISLEIDL